MEEFNVILENVLNFLKTDGVTLARNISIILLFFMLIKTIIRGMKKAVNKNQNIEKTIQHQIARIEPTLQKQAIGLRP